MGIFDNQNLDINSKLPEYWKSDLFLAPIERISSLIMRNALQAFMEKMSVLQPFMLWKTLPEEYHWEWVFDDYDIRLASAQENPNCNQTLHLINNNHIVAQLPLTKRNVDAKIIIELSSTSFSDTTNYTPIEELIIRNANQELKIKDINSKTTIEIDTLHNYISLNNAEANPKQIEGSLDIIKRSPRENPDNITDPLDINEVCELEIYIPGKESAYCNLYVQLYYPVYVTEQNIRIHSLSAFPLEYVRLYGYYCHPFNRNHQWIYLWEKTYAYDDRIVTDRITKQYDCEIFYAEIKIYGLPAPIYIGFPATDIDSSDGIFTLNENLDYWGEIFKMPRRQYKLDIPEEKERFCYPKYYNYHIEQDYPYEQRILNEYKYNEDHQDYISIYDTDGLDMALVKCKDPYIDNIYMYTETILPTDRLNSQLTVSPCCIQEDDNICVKELDDGCKSWTNPNNLSKNNLRSFATITLEKYNEENITNKNYKANRLSLEFNLETLPQNCKITGMELKFKGVSNTHANNIYIDDRSRFYYTQRKFNESTGDYNWQNTEIQSEPEFFSDEQVPLSNSFDFWNPNDATYTLGDKTTIFYHDLEISRREIEKGYKLDDGTYKDNKIKFDIGFTNTSDYMDIILKLYNIQLTVYYSILKEDVDVILEIPTKIITYPNVSTGNTMSSTTIDLNITYINKGEIKEVDCHSFVILPNELEFVIDEKRQEENYDIVKTQDGELIKTLAGFNIGKETSLNYIRDDEEVHVLDVNEVWTKTFTIRAHDFLENGNSKFKSGKYDIVVICNNHVVTDEVYIYDEDYAN